MTCLVIKQFLKEVKTPDTNDIPFESPVTIINRITLIRSMASILSHLKYKFFLSNYHSKHFKTYKYDFFIKSNHILAVVSYVMFFLLLEYILDIMGLFLWGHTKQQVRCASVKSIAIKTNTLLSKNNNYCLKYVKAIRAKQYQVSF